MTAQTLKVLTAFASHPQDEASGAEIARSTKLATGTLYPILIRLEEAGWLKSRWEADDPHKLGRPRKRLYRITGIGARKAQLAFKEFILPLKELAWR
jgi:PadR family transcriptional regulator, regulatory protein PadR